MQTDPRIDEYIKKAAPFSHPIMVHLRKMVHKACPEVVETMKWSFPHFDYKGLLCSMAAFKQHCSFGFWKGSLLKDSQRLLTQTGNTDMGRFDRITTLTDLPPEEVLIAYIHEAMRLNDEGIKAVAKPKKNAKPEIAMPDSFAAALKKNKTAQKHFDAFSPSHKREYLEWITDAKTDITRDKRINTAIEWLTQGKSRMWKYEK